MLILASLQINSSEKMKENFHKNLIKASPFGYAYHKILINEAGEPVDYEFIEVNKAFENLTGLDANDITGKKVSDVLPGIRSGSFDWISFYGKVAMEQGEEVFEQYSEPLQRWYKVQVYSPEKNFFATVFTDITTEKDQAIQLEKTEKRYRGLVESQSDLIVRVDKENRFTFVNDAYCKTFGKSCKELIGSDFFPLVHDDDRKATAEAMKDLQKPPYRCYLEQRAMTVNGWRWLAWEDNAILDEKGAIIEVQGVGRDITALKEKEGELRKQAESLQTLLKETPAVIYAYQFKNGAPLLHYISENVKRVLGFDSEAFINNFEFWTSCVFPEDLIRLSKKLSDADKLFIPGKEMHEEYRFKNANGDFRWLSDRNKVVLNHNNEIEVIGVWVDITDEKQKTDELNQYKQRLTLAQTFAKTGSWEYDIESGKLFWSKECEALFGLDEGAFEGTFEDFLKRVHPDDRNYVVEVNSPITQLKEGIPLSYEHRVIKSNGDVLWVKETAGLVNDHSGKPAKIIGLVADITQQKIAADAIENEEKLRQIVNNINGVFWLRSADRLEMLYVSPSIESLYGISQQELIDNPNAFTDAVHPDDKERVKKALAYFLRTGTYSEEYRIVKPDGEVRWMASTAFPVKNQKGETIRFAGIVNDITKLKENEIAVKAHADKLNALISAMPDIYFVMDRQGNYLDVIAADPSVLLAPPEKVIGHNLTEFFEAEEAKRHLGYYERCLSEKRLVSFEYQMDLNGKKMFFEARLSPASDEMLLAVVRDVTDRKQLLEANRNESEFREFLFKNDRNGLVILDSDHKVIDVNPRFCEMTGYTAEELLTMHTWDFDDIMTEKQVREGFDITQQVDVTFESRHRRKDGSTYDVEVSAISFYWKGERFVYCSCRDITERITAAKQLKESEEKYRMLFNANNDSISIFYINDDGSPSNFIDMNEAGAQIVGYTKEELLKLNVAQLEEEAPEDVRRIRVEEIMRDGHAAFETHIRHKSGEKLILETKSILINYKDKPAILNIARDITERKKSEDALIESEFKYRNLINNLHAGIVVHHPDSSIKFSNPQAAVILGLTQDQMDGKSAFDPEWKFVNEHGVVLKPEEYPVSIVIESKKPINGKVFGIDRPSTHDRVWVQLNAYPEFAQNNALLQIIITFIDISAIIKTEESLRTSEEFNRRLLATIPDLVIRTNLDGNIIFLNEPAASGSLFHEKEELMGRNMLSFIHESDLERAIENTKRMFEKPLGVQEYKLKLEDGQVLDYEVNGDVVRDAGNNPVGMVYIVRNITERKKAEAALRQSNDIVENIQVGLYIYHLEDINDDRTLRLKYANPASTAMTGLKADSITGKTLDEIFPNLRKMNVPQRYAEVVRSAKMRTFEDIHYSDDRVVQACYSVKAFPLPNYHVGIAFEDITEKVNIMEAIAQSNIRLKEAQAVGNIGSWDYNILNDKLVWSDQTYRIYGEDPDCFKPTFDEVINHYPEPDRELVLSAYDKAIKSKSDFSLDNRILTKSGDIRFVQQNAKVVLNDNGNPSRLIGSVNDITQRKLAQDAIIHGKQRLEAFLEISRRITTTFDEERIMQMIVDNAISIMGLGSGAVYLQNDEKTIKLAATSPSLPDDFPDVFRIANLNDHPHIARTFITSSFVFLEDSLTAKLTPAEQEIVKLRGLRSNLYLPISLREKTIGVLILSSVGETYHFTDEEIFMLQGFANQAAHIIDNVNNFTNLKKYASELEQQIAQREEAEEVIRQNEERFRQVAETNQTVIWEINAEGIYTYISPMAEKIWGYKPTELVGKVSYFNLHPEEGRKEFIEQTMKFVTETGSFYDLLNPIQKRDGSIIWVTSNGLPIFDEQGKLIGYRGSDQDVTERIMAENELRKFKTISD